MHKKLVLFVVSLLLAMPVALRAEVDHTEELPAWQNIRRALGFDSSELTIQQILVTRGVSVEHGFPITEKEEAQLSERLEIQEKFLPSDYPILHGTPGFGGFFFDHAAGGRATIYSTEREAASKYLSHMLGPALAAQVLVIDARWTWDELIDEAQRLTADLEGVPGITHVGVTANTVAVGVDFSKMAISLGDLRSRTVFELLVEDAPTDTPAVCTSRTNCHTPLRSGVEISSGTALSSLGFGVAQGSDRQYLVAGHQSGTTFSHAGLGTIGSVTSSAFYGNGSDGKAIQATNSQVSNDIYTSSSSIRNVTWESLPSDGMYVCHSGRTAPEIQCGTVTASWTNYYLNGILLQGASTNIAFGAGDSGGPVYFPESGLNARAIGLASTTGGKIARITDLLYLLGMSIVTS